MDKFIDPGTRWSWRIVFLQYWQLQLIAIDVIWNVNETDAIIEIRILHKDHYYVFIVCIQFAGILNRCLLKTIYSHHILTSISIDSDSP